MYKLIPKILGGLLILGVLPLPYIYYELLRVVVFFGLITYIYFSLRNKEKIVLPVLGLITVVFNPIIPLELSNMSWMVIDGFSGVFLFTRR
jgi:hypothetical protein